MTIKLPPMTRLGFITTLLLAGLLWGCSSFDKIDTSSAEGAFKLAEQYQKDGRYQEAIAQYSQVKNKFPYSSYSTLAELRIADIHFEREAFIEAQSAYQIFKELHPSHEKIAYVTYRLGMSYFKELPSTIDRDLSLADKAIIYFNETINSYPGSEYAEKAKEAKRDAKKMLAKKEEYIADFYFVREHYQSALGRYQDLLRKYPGVGLNATALYGAAVSAFQMGQKDLAKSYYQRLLADHSGTRKAKKAKQEVGDELQ